MDFQFSIVFDVAQFAEFVHEMADAGSSGPDHLRENFLTELSDNRLRRIPLPKFARSRRARARRFSLELNSWSIRSSSIRPFRFNKSAMNSSENLGSSRMVAIMASLAMRVMRHSSIAVAVVTRRG